ncbi:amino acid synthesis family protein [Babesia caballi]|uniref:Amino acid synthesis family protein n=1 Tax=Babesia caballi TaxID=5871 RepID=A0AAV4LRJ1_BABCB|nr:amino acid synthesis family protein [Babesia caballi]
MDRARLARSLRGIEDSFTSNEARAGVYAFAQKQLNVVANAGYVLSRIDPHGPGAVAPATLERYQKHARRILCATAGLCDGKAVGQGWAGGGSADGEQSAAAAAAMRRKIRRLRNDAAVAYALALGAQNVLHCEPEYAGQLLQQVDLSGLGGGTVVALAGALHKSELFLREGTAEAAEACLRRVISKAFVMAKLSSRECSLLLWRRVATAYMGGAVSDGQVKQIRTLLYNCHGKLEEEAAFSFEGGKAQAGSSGTPESRAVARLAQTLGNVYQAALILRQCEAGIGLASVFRRLGLSSLGRLDRMLELARRVGGRPDLDHASSDTHTKVGLAVRDATEDGRLRCAYERRVGDSAYTIDIVLTPKGARTWSRDCADKGYSGLDVPRADTVSRGRARSPERGGPAGRTGSRCPATKPPSRSRDRQSP